MPLFGRLALLFIGILYLTAPAVGSKARLYLMETIKTGPVGAPDSNLLYYTSVPTGSGPGLERQRVAGGTRHHRAGESGDRLAAGLGDRAGGGGRDRRGVFHGCGVVVGDIGRRFPRSARRGVPAKYF